MVPAGPAVTERAPTPGASGMGDPYFPQDGDGGIDVLHYDVRDGYSFRTGRLHGRTVLDVRATQDLSRFDLDVLLQVLLFAIRQPVSKRFAVLSGGCRGPQNPPAPREPWRALAARSVGAGRPSRPGTCPRGAIDHPKMEQTVQG
jgi:hypothetical protein